MAAPSGTLNEQFSDALIRHQVFLMRASGAVRDRIYSVLDETEDEISGRVIGRLAAAPGGLGSPRELRRLETVLRLVRRIRSAAWVRAGEIWVEELQSLALGEGRIIAGFLDTLSPVVLDLTLPPPRTLKAIATSRPFEGRTLREWSKHIEREDLRRIGAAIRTGMATGEPGPSIARRIVGTARLRGRDGVTQITRVHADSITRTAVNHIGNAARAELYRENADLFDLERFVATLDGRTTLVCASNDGETFKVGLGPRPPLHWRCRSLRIPQIGAGPISLRPARPATERGLLREFAVGKGIKVPSRRSGLPRGTKGAYDAFKARRLRELTGRLPARTRYGEWLRGQSREFQDDVLGPTRAKLFRDGRLELDRFVNRNGDQIPIKDLAAKHADAFRAAGIEPSGL